MHLTNYEVFAHLQSMRQRYDTAGKTATTSRVKSENLEAIMKEVCRTPRWSSNRNAEPGRQRGRNNAKRQTMDYFRAQPSPLAYPTIYTQKTIRDLFTGLQEYDLTKAEFMMIINLRPETVAVLDAVVEELDARFTAQQQTDMLLVISQVLGSAGLEGKDEDRIGQGTIDNDDHTVNDAGR